LAQRAFSLRLYKAIFKAHQMVLPPVMRELGDSYVREEFKRHKDARPEYLRGFFSEWLKYLDTMRSQGAPDEHGNPSFGKALDTEIISLLSEDQRAQLALLQVEATKVANASDTETTYTETSVTR
jgi:hypothetical protein